MGYGGHGMYFSCQKPDSEIPPMEGWRPRNQRGWDWTRTYAKQSSPNIAPGFPGLAISHIPDDQDADDVDEVADEVDERAPHNP